MWDYVGLINQDALTGKETTSMIIHKDSHTDHAISQLQWDHILATFEAGQ